MNKTFKKAQILKFTSQVKQIRLDKKMPYPNEVIEALAIKSEINLSPETLQQFEKGCSNILRG